MEFGLHLKAAPKTKCVFCKAFSKHLDVKLHTRNLRGTNSTQYCSLKVQFYKSFCKISHFFVSNFSRMRGLSSVTGTRWLRTVRCCCLWWKNMSRDYRTARPKTQQQVSLCHVFPQHLSRTARCEKNAIETAQLPLQGCATRHDG